MTRSAAKWPQVRLGDHIDLLAGFAFKSSQFTDNPDDIHLVKGENVQQGYVDWGKAKHWPFADWEKFEKFQLKQGDVVLAMDRPWIEAGLKYGWITHRAPRALLVQRVSRLRGTDTLATDFLRFVIGSLAFTDYIRPITTGVNVPHISPAQIKDFKFVLPPVADQRRIASILSLYDDLIENNTRRIAILEEIARRIYEEWFVRFRFPGHKKVRMVESKLGMVPEGWGVRKLGDVIELCYGKALKSEDRRDGPWPVYGSSGVVGYHNQSLVNGPGIIVGRKGNVGSVHWCDTNFYAIDTVYFVKTKLPLHYAFFNLRKQNFLNNDAAVPGLNRNQAYSLQVVVPSTEVLVQFVNACDPMFKLVRSLTLVNANLRTTRDLLLPKLISGELDVSHLPEPKAMTA